MKPASVLLSILFIMSGFNKIGGLEGVGGYIASKGLPMPQILAVLTIAIELGGGILLLVGWKARWAALALALFVLLAAFIFHNFWAMPEAEKMAQSQSFWKNVTIAGGMLMVLAFGPGRLSVDRN